MSDKPLVSLTNKILFGLIGGIVLGSLFHQWFPADPASQSHWFHQYITNGVLAVGADIFIRTLKMMVVPLVLVSLICGTSSLGDPKRLGSIGGKTVALYMGTTAMAITMSLLLGSLAGVGKGITLTGGEYTAKASPPLGDVIVGIVPSNPFSAMVQGQMLQVIFFSVLVGLSISLVGKPAQRLAEFAQAANDVIMKMVMLLMSFAPIGVFCVVTRVFAEKGLSPILDLFLYFVVMIAALLFHMIVTYGSLLKFVGRLNPKRFFENARPAMMFAFSTASSNATIPVTIETTEKHMGVNNSVASFTVSLGATINMDGTAIMQGIAAVFIANASGVTLTMTQYLMIILTSTLASIGTAGVPGVGMITLAMVLKQVGLPEEGILLLLPVDRILDMCRTTVNVTGDAAVTCVVAKSEKEFNQAVFDQPLGADYGNVSFNRQAD